MAEKIFCGMAFEPNPKTPWVKAKVKLDVTDLQKLADNLKEGSHGDEVFLLVSEGRSGKLYSEIDTFVPKPRHTQETTQRHSTPDTTPLAVEESDVPGNSDTPF